MSVSLPGLGNFLASVSSQILSIFIFLLLLDPYNMNVSMLDPVLEIVFKKIIFSIYLE